MQKEQPLKLAKHERYQDDQHRLVVGGIDQLSSNERDSWLQARQDFMSFKRWTAGESDRDDYDDDPDTVQFLLQNHEGELVAGMRLTHFDDVSEAKSIDMLGLEGGRLDVGGPGWDLTRLVPGPAMGERHLNKLAANAKLFGAALAHTLWSGKDDNPAWLFAIEEHFLEAFKRYGIEFTPLEYVPSSLPDSESAERLVLAAAHPLARTQFLTENSQQFKHAHMSVMNGVNMVPGTQLWEQG